MSAANPQVALKVGVKRVLDQLTLDELVQLNIWAQTWMDDADPNPEEVPGYDKWKGLLTIADGKQLHTEVVTIVSDEALRRINEGA